MTLRHRLAIAAALSMLAATTVPVLAQDERPHGPPDATPNPVPLEAPAGDGTAVRLTTELGDIVIELFNESAPVAAENFLNLATEGYYDGVGFHRAVPGFVLQGGDPSGTGRGPGPDYRIADEQVVGRYGRGIVAMARTSQPNSQGSQFFFVLDDAAERQLAPNNTYTIFGRVLEGMDVVDQIVAAREPSDLIEDPVRILSASVEQAQLPPEPTPAPPTAAELAADDLGARMPDEAGGYQLQKSVYTLAELESQFHQAIIEELRALTEDNGGDFDVVSIGQARNGDADGFVSIIAASIKGVPGEVVQDAMMRLLLQDPDASGTTNTIGSREVVRVGLTPDPGPGETAYVFSDGEIVWLVITSLDDIEGVIASLG